MGLLFASCSHLEAVREGGESQLSMAIKTEAMRQINIRLNDPVKRNTSDTLAAIAYMSSGVFVSFISKVQTRTELINHHKAVGAENAIAETETHEDGMMRLWYEGLGGKVPPNCIMGQTLLAILVL